ncbi:sensor histidine kinase [Heyndrickxia sp. NPDC080065]|uniref:sensor histidine kinase n=1 Tax=Heyndrickxia sp. NPDC080065 TaxID=3390568 RepID=UPI003D095139
MKWKLTGRFLFSVVLVVILVVFINIFLLLTFFIARSIFNEPFHGQEISAEVFTKQFQNQITISNDHISITEKGKNELIKNKAWIQVLDDNGKQLFGYRTPENLKDKYNPLDMIQMYKYREIDADTIVFIGEKKLKDKNYSYFIGFKNRNIQRYVVSYDFRDILKMLKIGSITLIFIDSLIALFIGYLFSKRLTKPINTLIDGIKRLANKDYDINYRPSGVYKDVFYNVNHLSYQLQASEMERNKLDKMKEEWIANISHDIKTPLASIQGYSEMMKDTEYHFSLEEMREYAEIIERKSVYLKEVIEDLNLSTRLRAKELSLNKTKTNLVALLRSIVIDILNDAKYSTRNIDFEFAEETIDMEVDELLIRRAINNLIYNAIVHNDEDVQITVSIKKEERIHIMIKDNGKGIKKEELDRIFDRYYRGTNTGESHKGSGLGMAIANDIIHAHDGEITIDSLVGHGTTIEIML